MPTKPVSLKKITHRNRAQALRLGLHRFQINWVPPVSQILKQIDSKAGYPPTESFGIYLGRTMKGFFACSQDPQHPDGCFLSGFLIDKRSQRQGLGTQALEAILRMIPERYLARARVRITLHPENPVARHFYWNAGFRPTGKWLNGEPSWEMKVKRVNFLTNHGRIGCLNDAHAKK